MKRRGAGGELRLRAGPSQSDRGAQQDGGRFSRLRTEEVACEAEKDESHEEGPASGLMVNPGVA